MKQTNFFFSSVIDLAHHSLSAHNMNAMYAVYEACVAINQPEKYGSVVHSIVIDAIHQDYESPFHQAALVYDAVNKSISAGVIVDLEKVLASDFVETVAIYQAVIFHVFDQIKSQVTDFDFETLKLDLQDAIQSEIEVAG